MHYAFMRAKSVHWRRSSMKVSVFLSHWYLWVIAKHYNMRRPSAGQICAADILCIDLCETCSCLSFLQCGVFLCWLLGEKYLFLSRPLTASHQGDAEIYCMHTQQQACGNLVHASNQRLVHSDENQTWRPCVFSCQTACVFHYTGGLLTWKGNATKTL